MRAQAMLRIEDVMQELTDEDRAAVAFEVWRTYGNTKTPLVLPALLTPNSDTSNTNNTIQGGRDRGGKSFERKHRDPVREQQALEVLQFLNEKAERSFRPVEENIRFIRARLNTLTLSDLKGVVVRKTREWKNTKYEKFLRPATLFNATNCEQYIGEQGKPS